MNRTAVLYALASAALFGASTPAAKALLGSIDPIVLAGLLYSGAGIGIALLRRTAPAFLPSSQAGEQAIGRRHWPWLAGAIAAGGIVGPLLLMAGLARTDASTASLLLTLEGAVTALMAWFIFHENFDRRIAIGMLSLLAGAAFLAWSGTPTLHNIAGSRSKARACERRPPSVFSLTTRLPTDLMMTPTREPACRGGRDHRNPWPASIGTGGRLRSESPADFVGMRSRWPAWYPRGYRARL
jgi:uncharacterized membrane protein